MKELQYLNKYFIKYKYRFLFGIFATIAAQIFMLLSPKFISYSFQTIEIFLKTPNASIHNVQNKLLFNILIIVLTTIASGVFTFLMRQTLIVMSRHIEFDLRAA